MGSKLNLRRIGIIGSGPSSLYLLKHLADSLSDFADSISCIEIFEQHLQLGRGMPFSPRTTDQYNLCNITSKELPALECSLVDWLRSRDRIELQRYGLSRDAISEDVTYSRLLIGKYFADQYQRVLNRLRKDGVHVVGRVGCRVDDIVADLPNGSVTVLSDSNDRRLFDTVVIATGHEFDDADDFDSGYYASPWPIQKLLPQDHERLNFTIGTLGASLSAFDVIVSLAHRHGRFEGNESLTFTADEDCEDFGFVMHSANGRLPHLQYEQVEPLRELYRHVSAGQLESLRDKQGHLRLNTYFDQVCRQELRNAFARDDQDDVVEHLSNQGFGIEKFVEMMTDQHDYADAFEGMRSEFSQALRSVQQDRPIHWKEIFDDLMYTLNFHAHWMPAEDHIRFQSVVMPFLLNVIAAMPLQSARILLALRDAGRLEIISGDAKVVRRENRRTIVEAEGDNGISLHSYQMFIDCTGQQAIKLDEFPFPSLVRSGAIRHARARFADRHLTGDWLPGQFDRLTFDHKMIAYQIGGIDVDHAYRVIAADGTSNHRLYDIAFAHTAGVRPYSYGLQACDLTARMVVDGWKAMQSRCH